MSGLVAQASVRELFRALLGEVLSERRLQISHETEFYLVNLLSEFVEAEKLYPKEEGGKKDHEALAILYHRALLQSREERIRTLRRLGDVSLYVAGFFGASLRDRAVGSDYYIQMGGTAYGHVAELVSHGGFALTYRELGGRFRDFVDILEEISARGMAQTGPEGVLRVYESWARSRNGRLEKVLIEAGVLGSSDGTKTLPN